VSQTPYNSAYHLQKRSGAPDISMDVADTQMLKVGFGRGPSRPASAAEGREGVDDDPSWQIGEMRPRGYSAPAKHPTNRCNNGCQLRVPEASRSPRPIHVSHALRKVLRRQLKHPSIDDVTRFGGKIDSPRPLCHI